MKKFTTEKKMLLRRKKDISTNNPEIEKDIYRYFVNIITQ